MESPRKRAGLGAETGEGGHLRRVRQKAPDRQSYPKKEGQIVSISYRDSSPNVREHSEQPRCLGKRQAPGSSSESGQGFRALASITGDDDGRGSQATLRRAATAGLEEEVWGCRCRDIKGPAGVTSAVLA